MEATLNQYPGVTQSAVLPAEAGRNRGPAAEVTSLVGFYVSAEPPDGGELLRHLGATLPSYMVPTELVRVDALPMTANGKLDVKALHALRSGVDSDTAAPRTELEGKIQEIVAGILALEPATVGVEDDLFGLGLNSILVIQLIAELKSELEVDVAVPSLFMAPTIAELTEIPEFHTARIKVHSSAD